jgi:hypothetical protein
MEAAVLLANPLPLALRSYVDDLTVTLEAAGRSVEVLESSGTEKLAEGSLTGRISNARRFYRQCRRRVRSGEFSELIVCWPLVGYMEFLLWAIAIRPPGPGGSRVRVRVIIHDVHPPGRFRDVRSWGFLPTGVASEFLARRVGTRVSAIVHTESAAAELRSRGWARLECLPVPIAAASTSAKDVGDDSVVPRHTLTVAGRYKPIREVAVLEALGAGFRAGASDLLLIGAGWPAIAGWTIRDDFVPENEFQQALAESGAVLIPYSNYSQSGVAIRAFEAGTPVIGIRHVQLAEMYGDDYPGMVDELTSEGVLEACRRVGELPRAHWLEVADAYRVRAVRLWQDATATDGR